MQRWIGGWLVLMLVVGGCAGDAGRPSSLSPAQSAAEATPAPLRPLAVDTDMDSSDVMALPYLLTLPDREVLAITVTATGVAHCPPGAANARAIAQAVGSDVPTACGPNPVNAELNPFPDAWRYPADELYGIDLALGASRSGGGGAVELLADVVAASDQPVEILTLGPLTNVAALLEAVPSAAERISRLVLMGGAIDAPGNVEANPEPGAPEWNIWADPEAARAVFASSIPITLVPLDATGDVPIETAFFEDLERDHGSVGADLAYELLARNPFLVSSTQFFWDQLTSAVLEDPDVVTVETMRLAVGEGADLGRTMRSEAGRSVQVAMSADRTRFESIFLEGLRRGPLADAPFAVDARMTVSWDGTACAHDAPSRVPGGTLEVTFADTTGASALLLGVLHEGASWEQLEALVASYRAGDAPPDFVTLVLVPGAGPVIVEAPTGTAGFICATLVDGEPADPALSSAVQIGG
jgi:pyrimidine-specific ribonucleoside hydrolase